MLEAMPDPMIMPAIFIGYVIGALIVQSIVWLIRKLWRKK